MDSKRRLDLQRKRNAELSAKLDEAKEELLKYQLETGAGFERAKDLIITLEQLKEEWERNIDEAYSLQKQLKDLIAETKMVRKGAKQPNVFSRFLLRWRKAE